MNLKVIYPKLVICTLLVLLCNTAFAQTTKTEGKDFPTPSDNPKQLFYLQRNENINTVVYEINEQKGMLDLKEPIHASWILYVKQGQREELSGFEKKFAYGIKIQSSDKEHCVFTLKAYPKITLHLEKDSAQKYHVYITPTKTQMILHKTFIKVKEGGHALKPAVEYVEFTGLEAKGGKDVTERIIP